jgi:TetR/AcrR family transcriptional repressor of bet genes
MRDMGARVELRRAELAETTLRTLARLGYSRTSVREIAQQSPFSHGVLHYYFKDKDELIVAAVRLFKERSSRRYDAVIAESQTADELAHGFAAKLVEGLAEDALEHRLWYDLRSQAMYDPVFRADVLEMDELLADMTWRVVGRYAELCGREVTVSRPVVYAALDGIFQKALLDHLAGVPDAVADLRKVAAGALDLFLAPA